MRILVFGGSGLFGMVLCERLVQAGHKVDSFRRSPTAPCRTQNEILYAFRNAIELTNPDCIINLIAATNVEQCQADMGNAALLNCFVPHALGSLCTRSQHLVQLSSDQVYEGEGPHDEQTTRPINTYALTKLIGEYPVLQAGGCVLRTNFFGMSRTQSRASLSDWLVAAGRNGQPVNVFEDVLFSPLGMETLSNAVIRAVELRISGLFNVGAVDGVSKAQFARLLFETLGLDTSLLNPSTLDSAPLKAPRPRDMRMDCSRFSAVTGFRLPCVRSEIANEAIAYTRP
jgi:dTDP-4-dehydrorhamnose reductase